MLVSAELRQLTTSFCHQAWPLPFSIADSRIWRQKIAMIQTTQCCCSELDDLAVIGMGASDGLDERIFATLEPIKDHGGQQWWLYMSCCKICSQAWMIAQDERIHDNFCFKRIDKKAMQAIVDFSQWPEDFLRYEDVLRLGRKSGMTAQFLDPRSPALIDTVDDLRRERPDITVDDIAYALAIPVKSADKLLILSGLKQN